MTYYPPTPPNSVPSTTTTTVALVVSEPLPTTGVHYWHTVYFAGIMIVAGVLAMVAVRKRK